MYMLYKYAKNNSNFFFLSKIKTNTKLLQFLWIINTRDKEKTDFKYKYIQTILFIFYETTQSPHCCQHINRVDFRCLPIYIQQCNVDLHTIQTKQL